MNVRTFSQYLPENLETRYMRTYRKIADAIHEYELLETILLTIAGIFCIIRAYVIFKHLTHTVPKKKVKVLILSLRTLPTPLLIYVETMFAHALMRLGAEVKLIFHDGVLSSTDAKTILRSEDVQNRVSRWLGPWLKRSLGVPWISYRNVLTSKDIAQIKEGVRKLKPEELKTYTYLGVPVGAHANISAIRYFLAGYIDVKNSAQVAVLRKKLIDAMIGAKAAQVILKREKPNALFTVHGIYATWGPFRNYCQNHGSDTIIYSNMSPRTGYFMFNRNSDPNEIVSKNAWEVMRKKPLTQKQEKALNNFFDKRMKQKIDDQKLFIHENYDKNNPKGALLEELKQGRYRQRFVLFSNLAWDALIEGTVSPIFTDTFDWIDEHITFFKKKPEYQLIIKPHPGEEVWEKTTKKIGQYIQERHGKLPKNIPVLQPTEPPLKAYELQELNPINIVFNGTLGVELPYLGRPVLVGANAIHYNDAGVVLKIHSRKHYRELLNDPTPLVEFAEAHQADAKRYAYFYFFTSMIRIPFYRDDIWSEFDWGKVRNYSWLKSDSNIMKITKRIIERKDIYNPL